MRIRGIIPLLALVATAAAPVPLAAKDAGPRIDTLQVELVKRVSPAVVGITCQTHQQYYGTGVVIDPRGRVLTNLSVVPPQGTNVQVYFRDGGVHPAKLVEYDVKTESALIQIEGQGKTFPHVALADSEKARVGQRVYTFGNPFFAIVNDAQVAAAAGSLSGIGGLTDNAEERNQSAYEGPILETDAAVNPGSDGGPVVDEAGRLLGIMSLAFQKERLLGTSIPVHLIAKRLRALAGVKLEPPPTEAVTATSRVLARRARAVAASVVWVEIERTPEEKFQPPKKEELEKAPVLEQLRIKLRQMMERPPGYATGIALEGGTHVLTSAFHVSHNREGKPAKRGEGPLIKSIRVHADGLEKPLSARIVSRFEPYDLALLEVQGGKLPHGVGFGTSARLVEGSAVGVLGRQRGMEQITLTQGVVSATSRNHNLVKVFQTDADINYANLGGPVVDLEGQVVGMAAFLNPEASWGINSGVGLFTGADRIRAVLAEMKAGKSQKNPPLPFLGIRVWMDKSLGGAAVGTVFHGSAAQRAGLLPGDLIVSLDGDPIGEWPDLMRAITSKAIGQTIEFEVKRNGQQLKLKAKLGQRKWEEEE